MEQNRWISFGNSNISTVELFNIASFMTGYEKAINLVVKNLRKEGYLKKNKKRTLLTIIGIIISLSLISGVGFLGLSFNEYMYNRAIDNNGDYEFGFSNVDKDVVNILRNDVDLKNVGVFSNVGLGKYVLEDKDENSIYITEQDETYST